MNTETGYISLEEATKYCQYSQEYLSLRARQGKLKSVKFGRNWVTKKEWLEEYEKKFKKYNNQKNNKKTQLISSVKKPVLRLGFLVALVFVLFVSSIIFGKDSFKNTFNNLNLSAEAGKASVGILKEYFPWLQKETVGLGQKIVQTYSDTNESIENNLKESVLSILGTGKKISRGYVTTNNFIEEKLATAIGGYPSWVSFKVSGFPENIVQGYNDVNNSLEQKLIKFGSTFKPIPQQLAKGYLATNDFIERKIGQSYKSITRLFTSTLPQPSPTPKAVVSIPTPEILTPTLEKVAEETALPQPAKEGLVVISSTAKDEETIKKIKESFSDEVKVEIKDETSGIIIPVFKEGEGQKYLYILVPIKSEL